MILILTQMIVVLAVMIPSEGRGHMTRCEIIFIDSLHSMNTIHPFDFYK